MIKFNDGGQTYQRPIFFSNELTIECRKVIENDPKIIKEFCTSIWMFLKVSDIHKLKSRMKNNKLGRFTVYIVERLTRLNLQS